MVLKKVGDEYVLLSKKTRRVLRRFGRNKPSEKELSKTEKSIQFWKTAKKHPNLKKIVKKFYRRKLIKRKTHKSSWLQHTEVKI